MPKHNAGKALCVVSIIRETRAGVGRVVQHQWVL